MTESVNPLASSAGPAPERPKLYRGTADLRRLLRPFKSYEEERADYEHCLHYDGEHGVPAGSYIEPMQHMQAILHYLDLKLAAAYSPSSGGPPPEFVCSSEATLSDEERATLRRLNTWLLHRERP